MNSATTPFDCIAGTSVVFLARHRHVDGTYAIPGNTSGVHVKVTGDENIGNTLDADIDPADCLFPELQDGDPRWPADCNDDDDEQGYNFRYTTPVSAFPSQGHYRVEFKITHTDETVTKIVFEGPARSSST